MQGAVRVTHHGRPRVVVLSADEYDRLLEDAERGYSGGLAQEKGDESNAAAAAILTGMGEGFFALDEALRIVEVNPVAEAYLEQTSAQLRGQPLYPPELAERGAVMLDRLRWVLRSGESSSFECASLHRPGRYLGIRAFPYRRGVGVVFSNLTEQRALKGEQATWRAEREALAAHGWASLAELNVLGFFTSANTAFMDFIGFTLEQLQDVRLADLAAAAGRHDLARCLNGLLQQKLEVHVAEVEFLTRERGRQHLKVAIARRMRDDACDGFSMVALPIAHGAPEPIRTTDCRKGATD